MINVDVYVPSVDRTYNFNLDEEVEIRSLLEELAELICKKEGSATIPNLESLMMGSMERKINFNNRYSLKNYSIKNGDTLILV